MVRPMNRTVPTGRARGSEHDDVGARCAGAATAGIFPTNDGEANVFISTPADADIPETSDRASAYLDLLTRTSPLLVDRLRGARLTSPVRAGGACRTTCGSPPAPGGRSSATPVTTATRFTGHGFTDAVCHAEPLARQLGRALRREVSEAESALLAALPTVPAADPVAA
jgi:hypothetical protein